MPITKTINFLPSVFQSETNRKFLNATLDQLVTEPNLVPINGYVGRKFAPGFDGIGTYIRENTADRADYQLEPGIVVKDGNTGEVEFHTTYPEVLQKISYYGAKTDNQDNLWESEYYSFNPRINADAFINFSQYYWLPNGPDPVQVFAGPADLERAFYVYPDNGTHVYNLSGYGNNPNPVLTLVRGGNYIFNVSQTGKPFWIQTEPGVSGISAATNLSTREILGVANNGADDGVITIAVPAETAQDFYITMPITSNVDLVSPESYASLQGKLLSQIVQEFGGIDGQRSNLNGKLIIFANYSADPADWTHDSVVVPENERYGIWQIVLTPVAGDYIFDVYHAGDIAINNKVLILSGVSYGNTQWYYTPENVLAQVPIITAPLDVLYYQDGNDASQYGVIRLVDQNTNQIDIDNEILGKLSYVSPNGVTFTNGLKVEFDSSVIPESYQGNQYYVEGVGSGIVLISVSSLIINQAQSKPSYNPDLYFAGCSTANLTAAKDVLTITSNVFPTTSNVTTGIFPNNNNTNQIVAQNIVISYPYRAGQDLPGEHTSLMLSTETIAMSLAGIPINGISNGAYIPGADDTRWNYDVNQVLINGQDAYGGQVLPIEGKYVYTSGAFVNSAAWANVSGFADGFIDIPSGHSKLVGFSADGYPIYGPYGYSNPTSSSSTIIRMISSYDASNDAYNRPLPKTTTATSSITDYNYLGVTSTYGLNPGMRIMENTAGIIPGTVWIIDNGLKTAEGLSEFSGGVGQVKLSANVTIPIDASLTFEFLAGAFIEDYSYEENSGTLDQYNGRYCVTPEFPMGTYAYFVTQLASGAPAYPYIIGPGYYGSITYDTNLSLSEPDYLLINRASKDLNPWTRRNRWFHQSVIALSNSYNNTAQSLDSSSRAVRPIIEFDPDLQLINFGKIAKQPVDIYDTQFTDPFLSVEGTAGIYIDGVNIIEGMRIVFSAATDPEVRNAIWVANFVNVVGISETDPKIIHLTKATDGTVLVNETVSVFNGYANNGKSFWNNGINWVNGQQKTSTNQAPLFDVFDSNGVSYSDVAVYPSINEQTKFIGTKIFSYKTGTGPVDPVLGFSLSYKNFNNIGDIQFTNNFDSDYFQYNTDSGIVSQNINSGFLYKNISDSVIKKLNVWTTVINYSRQMQDLAYTYNGIDNSFVVDIVPNISSTQPNFLVFINAKRQLNSNYQTYRLPNNQLLLTVNKSVIRQNDRIDVLIYSDDISKIGFYQIPDNLNLNAQNSELQSPTLGEMRNHIGQLSQSNLNFIGTYPGLSNLRDLYVSNEPGLMLQQSAPTTYASLFLNSDQYNFIDSLSHAQQEYTRFKNKFLQIAYTGTNISQLDPVTGCDTIIKQINAVKDKSFPWYYSGTVPYGDNKNVITYTVFNPSQKIFEITTIFSNDVVSNKAILLYLNGTQLIYGKQYEFSTNGPGVLLTDSITLSVNDVVSIVEYNNTDGGWVPETPSKLGLYPKYVPKIYLDKTYLTPQTMIMGHDGSLTPAFGDFRDQLILELEKRIFNNIKVAYSDKLVNIYDAIPGKFRDTGYSINEFNNLLSRIYLQWVGNNKLDYVSNNTYQDNAPFTYNYGGSPDVVNGEALPGSWRACFEYFYDTQTPNNTPWEMLGFSEEPSWWSDIYGPAPYTSGNSILWTDLQNGYIASGIRQGYDTKFARPGLLSFIPVDEFGRLVPPIGNLTTEFVSNTFKKNWTIGQMSPTETAWRNSSEYPFALQFVCALIKPAKYFSYGIQTNKYRFNEDLSQYVISNTNKRITPADVEVNGYTSTAGVIHRATGYLNWVSDYQTYLGITDKLPLMHFVKDYSVQLSYRMASYSGKEYLKILAEQNSPNSTNDSIIIPDDDFNLVLNKSTPILNARYSAIIIEKTANGYRLSGYDSNRPYITIIPPMLTGKYNVVKILEKSANYYTEFNNYKISIPYGTELTTPQQIANLFAGYERYLNSLGFRFDQFDQDLGQIRNWELSLKEFLFWEQQGWQSSSVIVMSPCADSIRLINPLATVDAITNTVYGSKIVNQNSRVLTVADYSVMRDNNVFRATLNSSTDLIGYIEVNLVQYEHVVIFNNRTQFNDIIYDPILGQRQYRLKFVGTKTGGWTGTLSAQGFMYNQAGVDPWRLNTDYLKGDLVEYKDFYYSAITNLPGATAFNFSDWMPVDKNKIKTGLINNFSRNAQIGETFYNVDRVNLESNFDQFSLSLIGYKNRNYLNDLGLDDVSQVKFYQGFIKEKGTTNAIDALGHVTFIGNPSDVSVSEDWAFRVGTYGSININQYVELVLDESYTLNNPTSLEIQSNNAVTYSSLYLNNGGIFKTSQLPWAPPFLLNRTTDSNYSDDIQTAGYVNVEDIDYTIFDLTEISVLNAELANIGSGDVIWVAKDYQLQWDILRVNETGVSVIEISNALNGRIKIKTSMSHGLLVNDVVILNDVSIFSGFYKVTFVDSLVTFIVEYVGDLDGFSTELYDGVMLKLQSMKVDYPVDIANLRPQDSWKINDKAWVNYHNSSNEWAVYNKSEPWSLSRSLPKSTLDTNSLFGESLKLSNDGKFAITGIPGYNNGVGAITNYVVNFDGQLVEDITLTSTATDTVSLGAMVNSSLYHVIAGAPGSSNNRGYVFIYNRDEFGAISETQILAPNVVSSGNFGNSIAISQDSQWLYVGAPGDDCVYVYAYNALAPTSNVTFSVDGLTSSYTLPFAPVSAESILVRSSAGTYVPFVDYTLAGSLLTFTSPPTASTMVITQTPCFTPYTVLTGNAGSNFGFSISATNDGAQLVVGSPLDDITIGANTYVSSGSISVYDRSIEDYIVSENQIFFGGVAAITQFTKVYVNNEVKTLNVDWEIFSANWVKFYSAPPQSSIVTIETNVFRLAGSEIPLTPYANQQFGYSTDICSNNCSIYVGAPYQSETNTFAGAAYRFLNQGRVYGTITGTVQSPVVNSGDSIRINDFMVNFNDVSLSSVIAAINSANIPGVVATNYDGYLNITCNSSLNADKLRILPGIGSALVDLGLDVFTQVEVISNSTDKSYDYFGKKVKINYNGDTLVVASKDAATLEETTFDASLINTAAATTFDATTTRFIEAVAASGAVWIYSYLPSNVQSINSPGKFIFIQQLTPTVVGSSLQSDDRFGSDIDINTYTMLIGANGNKQLGNNAGKIYQFNNTSTLLGWDVLRYQEPRVDISSIIKAYVYNAATQQIQYNFDYIDPAKGKILGLAEQDISYKIDYDPAVYNYATSDELSTNNTLYWGNQQVGQVWWDLSKVRYMLYEQGSIKYRNANWGRTFPGSSIDVYEWVESDYPPNRYIETGGSGIPKYPNNDAYVTLNYIDPVTNFTTVKYYFWVKDKTTLTVNQFGRSMPTVTIADYIRDPKSSGVKYFSTLRDDSIGIYNMIGETTDQNTIFHLAYATQLNSNIIHSEYSLLSENNVKSSNIPQNIYKKLIDSVSGIDLFGNPVPDPTLPVQSRYGIDIRPRQSMFIDRSEAVKEMVSYVNTIFANNVISEGFDLTTLSQGEPYPAANSGAYDLIVANLEELSYINLITIPVGYTVLVESDSSVSGLWAIYIKDQTAETWAPNTYYKENTVIVYGDGHYIATSNFTSGATFNTNYLVTYVVRNVWVLKQVQSYDTSDYWDYTDWYATDYDKSTIPTYTVNTSADLSSLALRARDTVKILNNGQGNWFIIQIFPNIVKTVAIQNGTLYLKDNLYDSVKYGLSYDTGGFDIERFDQNPSIETRKILEALQNNIFINRLDFAFLELFFVFVHYILNEQKYVDWMFKTSFINVLQQIQGLTQPPIYIKENQDFYRQYIEEVKPYKTTIREYVVDYQGNDNYTGYVTDFDLPSYYDPVLNMYRSPSGEFIQDAAALQQAQYRDWVLNYPYSIESFEIINGGTGYTLAPAVSVTGSTIGNNAVARVLITNGVISKILVIYPGSHYTNTPVVTISGGNGIGGAARALVKNALVRSVKTTMVYDRLTYGTSVLVWQPNTVFNQGDVIAHNNIAYVVNQTFVTGLTFTINNLTVYPVTKLLTANDRITAYYQPELGQPAKNFGLLQTGITYPGVEVQGPLFSDGGGFDVAAFDASPFDPLEINEDGTFIISDKILDATISSTFTDSSLGIKPEDIIINGGPYVYDSFRNWAPNTFYDRGSIVSFADRFWYTVQSFTSTASFDDTYLTNYNIGPYASHSPEELVPGRIFDTLDLKVYTIAGDITDPAFQAWMTSQGLLVGSIAIADPGEGYTPGAVGVIIDGGSPLTQATAQVTINANGQALSFSIINMGAAYETTPTVVVVGANSKPIVATAIMKVSNAPSSSNPYPLMAYRIFKDVNDNYTYLRLDSSASTTLLSNLDITDTVIYVDDASKLPEPAAAGAEPGVVFINGERITYYQKDASTNSLTQLRRGTAGTGATVHGAGEVVVDGSFNQIVYQSSNYSYTPNTNVTVTCTDGNVRTLVGNVTYIQSNLWYTLGSSTATNEAGLFAANTLPAAFIREGLWE